MLSLVRTYHRTSGYLQFNLGVLLRVADRNMDLVSGGTLSFGTDTCYFLSESDGEG